MLPFDEGYQEQQDHIARLREQCLDLPASLLTVRELLRVLPEKEHYTVVDEWRYETYVARGAVAQAGGATVGAEPADGVEARKGGI